MKYKLSFCEIEQLSDNIFEVTINEGVIIDEVFALEAEKFWHALIKKPYRLLVNNNNNFSYSFMGSQKIGEHLLEEKTAVLIDDPITEEQLKIVLDLKKMSGNAANRMIFHDRDEAIKWLETP